MSLCNIICANCLWAGSHCKQAGLTSGFYLKVLPKKHNSLTLSDSFLLKVYAMGEGKWVSEPNYDSKVNFSLVKFVKD